MIVSLFLIRRMKHFLNANIWNSILYAICPISSLILLKSAILCRSNVIFFSVYERTATLHSSFGFCYSSVGWSFLEDCFICLSCFLIALQLQMCLSLYPSHNMNLLKSLVVYNRCWVFYRHTPTHKDTVIDYKCNEIVFSC